MAPRGRKRCFGNLTRYQLLHENAERAVFVKKTPEWKHGNFDKYPFQNAILFNFL
jgi:hypothetical protein